MTAGRRARPVPLNDVKALTGAIDTPDADDDLRLRYAEAAHQRIVENFTTAKAVALMNSIYAELLA